jgi:hypothetical protein
MGQKILISTLCKKMFEHPYQQKALQGNMGKA